MDNQRIYIEIIERSRTREIPKYKERHHIIPICLGGNNSKDNLAYITPRKHFICHWLLVKMYPRNNRLKHALAMIQPAYSKTKKFQEFKIHTNLKL